MIADPMSRKLGPSILAMLALTGCGLNYDLEVRQCNEGSRKACEVIARTKNAAERVTTSSGKKLLQEEIIAIKAKEEKLAKEKAEAARIAAEKATWGDWIYSIEDDEASGKKGKSATLLSENTLSFSFPYGGEQHGSLTIRQHPRYGFNAIVSIQEGQILCSEYSNPHILVRFDGGTVQRFRCSESADHDSTYTFINNAEGFESQMRRAKMVYITLTFYQEGSQTLKFKVKGFDPSKV